jgi:hypothetical protein
MPRGDLLVDPMIEQDDAIGHVVRARVRR